LLSTLNVFSFSGFHKTSPKCVNTFQDKTYKEPKKSDIGLDVVIVTLHGGDAFTVDFDTAIIPLFWRPKVKLVSRLYNIEHNKTIKTFSVSKSITWREFIAKQFSLRGFFRWGPLYHTKDMEILLYKACYELLNKMRKAI